MKTIEKSHKLDNVCYDIRGKIHQEALRLEDEGVRILKLNIGNLAAFGFEAPEEVVRDVVRNLPNSQGYCESNGCNCICSIGSCGKGYRICHVTTSCNIICMQCNIR